MEKYIRKPEKKVVFMEEVKRRVASVESQQQVAKSLETNECTQKTT
jgi:hypothetical protein